MKEKIEILKGTPPGRIIEYTLKEKRITQNFLAKNTGVTKQMINAVISGKRDLSIELSLKIEKALEYDEGFLLHLQTLYKIEEVKRQWSKERYKNGPNLRRSLFWDYDFDNMDWGKYRSAIIHRILERGTEEEKREIARFYDIPYEELGSYRLPERYYTPRKNIG